MKKLYKNILVLAVTASLTATAYAEKISREDLKKELPKITEQFQGKQQQGQFLKLTDVKLGEGSSLIFSIQVLMEHGNIIGDEKKAFFKACTDINRKEGFLQSIDYIQYDYYDINNQLKNSMKLTDEKCQEALENNSSIYDENGRYSRNFIQEFIVNQIIEGKDEYNKNLQASKTEIRNARIGEGLSYVVEYSVFGNARDVYKNADENTARLMKEYFITSMCSQQALVNQLPYLDKIDYEIYDRDGKADDAPLVVYEISLQSCKK